MNRTSILTSHLRASSNNRRARQVAQRRASGTTGLADPRRAPASAPEVAASVFREPIFRRNPCIDLARPAVNATMMPDSATALREFIKPCPSPRLRCSMPPRPANDDVVDKTPLHRSTPDHSSQHLLQKRCPQEG
jgi:hypothetical protein